MSYEPAPRKPASAQWRPLPCSVCGAGVHCREDVLEATCEPCRQNVRDAVQERIALALERLAKFAEPPRWSVPTSPVSERSPLSPAERAKRHRDKIKASRTVTDVVTLVTEPVTKRDVTTVTETVTNRHVSRDAMGGRGASLGSEISRLSQDSSGGQRERESETSRTSRDVTRDGDVRDVTDVVTLVMAIPTELRSAAEMLGVPDVDVTWTMFTGHNSGRSVSTLPGGLNGAWQAWCGRELKIQRGARGRKGQTSPGLVPVGPTDLGFEIGEAK